jgi:hypothetical protein
MKEIYGGEQCFGSWVHMLPLFETSTFARLLLRVDFIEIGILEPKNLKWGGMFIDALVSQFQRKASDTAARNQYT